jgi:membrane-associated phospholipid phosphatase
MQCCRDSPIRMDAQVPTETVSRKTRRLVSPLHSTDRLLLLFWGLLSCVSLLMHSRIPGWRGLIAANFAVSVLVIALAWASEKTGSRVLRCIHDWAAFLLVIFTYKQIYYMIRPLHQGRDYDPLLIALDRRLFGVNPTEWLARLSTPVVTEVLQIAYSLFYVIFLAVGFELYRKDHTRFSRFSFTIVYGFLLSYIGYFFLPAVGPRFTLHDFSRMNNDLPGLLLTPWLRWFVNVWESIPADASNSAALASAQRDVFPSGHTMMTLVSIVLAYRYRLKLRAYVLVSGVLLIAATVYLRYHYAIDLLAGAVLAILCLLTAGKLYGLLDADPNL